MQIFAIGDNHYIYLERYGFNLMLKDIEPKNIRIRITLLIATL